MWTDERRRAEIRAGWPYRATALGSGVAESAQIIDSEIDKATAGSIAAILPRIGRRSAARGRPVGGRARVARSCDCRDRRARRRVLFAGNLSPAWRMPARARPWQLGRGAVIDEPPTVRITGRHCPDRGTIGRSGANRDYRMSTRNNAHQAHSKSPKAVTEMRPL